MISATMKMRSPLLNAMFDSVVKSPCSRIVSTPHIDSSTPNACAAVRRTPRMASDHSATTSGAADWSSSVLSAWVCSSAQYCSVLKAPMPVIDSTIIRPSLLRIAGQSWARCFQANGSTSRKAKVQRRNDSVTGGMWPHGEPSDDGIAYQHSAVMLSSR